MVPHAPARVWFDAWIEAAYGVDGFWSRRRPDEHFRTAAASGGLLAEALAGVADRLAVVSVVDVGAGNGDLLAGLARLRPGLALGGVDLGPRPVGLPDSVGWAEDRWDVRYAAWTTGAAPALLDLAGPVLITACEWLDDLPGRVVQRAADGWREIVVDGGGAERPGPRLVDADLEWTDRWWPTGQRAEVGRTRDLAWAALAEAVRRRGGGLVLVDYGHERATRPVAGSFAAYRDGRAVPPAPSAQINLTAHLALDSVRAAGEAGGLRTVLDCRQDEALARLVMTDQPSLDPLADLARRSEHAALASAYGFGTHRWLVQVP